MPGAKRPALSRWTEVAINEVAVTRWTRQYPGHGVGLRTGTLVGSRGDLHAALVRFVMEQATDMFAPDLARALRQQAALAQGAADEAAEEV